MEELQSCTRPMLQLGAGCTAPPPTPVRRAEPADSGDADDDIFWSSPPSSTPPFYSAIDFVDEVGTQCSSSGGLMCQNSPSSSSTTPSRAELDELALYLMQQSLLSTPTLLASPSLRRRQKQGFSPDKGTNGGATDKSSRTEQESQRLVVSGRPATYSYSMEGFCEENKTGVQKACEEDGAFYVRITDFGKASLVNVDHFFKQCPSMNGMCLIGSLPPLAISELLTSPEDKETITCWQEDGAFELLLELPFSLQDASTVEALTKADFREAMRMFANLLVGISKELLKFLLEDVSGETRNNLRGQFLNPLLYIYKDGSQEPRRSRGDDNVVLSIISHGNPNPQGHNEKESLLAILGSQMQGWSQGSDLRFGDNFKSYKNQEFLIKSFT
ncbi:hypothetical protein GOP47_0001844 [Adiantum capillus-veneris]|uniref:Uncharacterized protein n=1 Tax=Adiantum capillus-veneris TaxID=13818 RepID=A0A9D4VAC7_ADICA|nr:hypothetical protein GOP47_0001844 [Adiantum capillus-veneris]